MTAHLLIGVRVGHKNELPNCSSPLPTWPILSLLVHLSVSEKNNIDNIALSCISLICHNVGSNTSPKSDEVGEPQTGCYFTISIHIQISSRCSFVYTDYKALWIPIGETHVSLCRLAGVSWTKRSLYNNRMWGLQPNKKHIHELVEWILAWSCGRVVVV